MCKEMQEIQIFLRVLFVLLLLQLLCRFDVGCIIMRAVQPSLTAKDQRQTTTSSSQDSNDTVKILSQQWCWHAKLPLQSSSLCTIAIAIAILVS
jgi:hypothetical protein